MKGSWRVQSFTALIRGLGTTAVIALAAVLFFVAMDGFSAVATVAFWTLVVCAYVVAFAMAGWALVLWPISFWRFGRDVFVSRYATELAWVTAALIAYGALVVSWAGLAALEVAWMPALIGLFSALHFRMIRAKGERT